MKFDEHLTSQARLSIVSSLAPGKPLSFMELRAATGLADGNLHVQTRKLAAAGYIEIAKAMRGRRSLTRFRLTELGLESLKLHIRKLQAIVATESGEIRPQLGAARKEEDHQVWS